jgi:hypothetical protein
LAMLNHLASGLTSIASMTPTFLLSLSPDAC